MLTPLHLNDCDLFSVRMNTVQTCDVSYNLCCSWWPPHQFLTHHIQACTLTRVTCSHILIWIRHHVTLSKKEEEEEEVSQPSSQRWCTICWSRWRWAQVVFRRQSSFFFCWGHKSRTDTYVWSHPAQTADCFVWVYSAPTFPNSQTNNRKQTFSICV